MINNENYISEKVKANAISAYLMLFISWLLLFNKSNSDINNDFVKKHTKSAILIHLLFLINYIVFVSNGVLSGIEIFGFTLSYIIANSIFIFLLGLLALGIYKAKNGESYKVADQINIKQKRKLIDINGDGEVSEKEKLTILLANIPFLSFFIYGKYRENEVIKQSTTLSLFISLLLALLYAFGYINLANVFTLLYIIFITFIGINLFSRNEIININLPDVFSPSKKYLVQASLIKYIKNYFSNNEFIKFEDIYKEKVENKRKDEKQNKLELNNLKDTKLPKLLIYIPFINLIGLFFLKTKYRIHIINSIVLTIIYSLLIVLNLLNIISFNYHILMLFPVVFGFSQLQNNIYEYKIPYIYDLFELTKKIIEIITFSKIKLKEKRKEDNNLNLKVKK